MIGHGSTTGWRIAAIAVLCVGTTWSAVFSARPWGAFSAGIVFLICIVLPGETARRALRLTAETASFRLALAYGLGLAIAPWILIAASASGFRLAGPVILAGLGLPVLAGWRRPIERYPWKPIALAALASVMLCGVLFVPAYRFGPEGMVLLNPFDSSRHDLNYLALLVNAANGSFPPGNPFVAGIPLNYHMGYPLLNSALGWPADHNPYDLVLRFGPIWFWTFAILAVYGAWREAGLANRPAALAAALALGGGGILALPFLLAHGGDFVSSIYAMQIVTTNNFYSNPSIVAVPLAILALVTIGLHLERADPRWGWAATLLVTGLLLHKSFFHPVVVAAWSMSMVVQWIRGTRPPWLFFVVSVAASAPVWFWYLVGNDAGAAIRLAVSFTPPYHVGRLPFAWAHALGSSGDPSSIALAIAKGLMATGVFLLGVMGAGLLGVRRLVRHLVPSSDARQGPTAWAIVLGTTASLFVMDIPHVHITTEWFIAGAQAFIWLFAAPVVARGFARPVAGIALTVLLFAGTVQSVYYLAGPRWEGDGSLPADVVQASFALRDATTDEWTALIPPDEDIAPAVLAGGALYFHPSFREMAHRYLKEAQIADRVSNYDAAFAFGRTPDRRWNGPPFWAGARKGTDAHEALGRRGFGRIDSEGWSWFRLEAIGSPTGDLDQ